MDGAGTDGGHTPTHTMRSVLYGRGGPRSREYWGHRFDVERRSKPVGLCLRKGRWGIGGGHTRNKSPSTALARRTTHDARAGGRGWRRVGAKGWIPAVWKAALLFAEGGRARVAGEKRRRRRGWVGGQILGAFHGEEAERTNGAHVGPWFRAVDDALRQCCGGRDGGGVERAGHGSGGTEGTVGVGRKVETVFSLVDSQLFVNV